MPSAQGIKEQLGRQFEGEGESSGKSFGKGFGGLLKKVLTGAAVAKSLKAFGSIVRQGVDILLGQRALARQQGADAKIRALNIVLFYKGQNYFT